MTTAAIVPTSFATTHTVDIDGEVSWLDFGGPADGPVVVAVHGLGGAAWNWAAIAPALTDHVRLLAPDLRGHGLTRSGGLGTTVRDNRRLLDSWLREIAGAADRPVVLMGNSMGGAIALLEAARAPELVSRVVLIDPALPRPAFGRLDPQVALRFAVASVPVVGARLLRRRARRTGVEAQVRETLQLCTVDVGRIPADVVALGVAVSEQRATDPAAATDFLGAARSVVRLLARPGPLARAAAAVDAAGVPVLLVHGERDRLVPASTARSFARRHPTWELVTLPDIGHVPMLEAPDATASLVLGALRSG